MVAAAFVISAYSQDGVDGVLELIWLSVGWLSWLGRLTNSLTTLEEPFRASLCTLEESLLEDLDFDFEDVFGCDMMVIMVACWGRCGERQCCLRGLLMGQWRWAKP